MGVDEVIAGLQSENVNTPLGRLNRNGAEYPIRISGKPEVVERFKTMVIGQRSGRPILLSEVAEVRDGIEEQRSLALINGIPAVSLDILKQSGANTVGVVAAVKKEIKRLQPELPQGTTIEMVRDGSIMIQDSVRDVQETMLLGGTADRLHRLSFPQFLAFHRHHRIDPSHLGHLFFHRHVFPGDDTERADPDGPLSRHRNADR